MNKVNPDDDFIYLEYKGQKQKTQASANGSITSRTVREFCGVKDDVSLLLIRVEDGCMLERKLQWMEEVFSLGSNWRRKVFRIMIRSAEPTAMEVDEYEKVEEILKIWEKFVFKVHGGKLRGSGVLMKNRNILTAYHLGTVCSKAQEIFQNDLKMGAGESTMALDKHLFELKFAAKQLEKNAQRCEKEEKVEKDKLTAAIKKGNREVAQVHAENAIRKKNEAVNYIRMAARIDAVAARVQTAATQKRVTTSMKGVVTAMESAMKSMNLEKVQQLMDRFERDFEDLDVTTKTMERTMDGTTVLNAPKSQVDALITEAADKAGIELNQELPSNIPSEVPATSQSVAEDTDLTQRLAALRNM